MGTDIDDLERRARLGDGEAQLLLASRLESQGDQRLARGWYARAAERGYVAGLRSLAIHLLTHEPIVHGDGVNMIRAAAEKGDAQAAYVCGMLAAQDQNLAGRWQIARECVEIAAQRGWVPAREQLAFLGNDFREFGRVEASPVSSVSAAARIGVIEGFARPAICDWLIDRARPRLVRAMVYDRETGRGRTEGARSNSSIAFDIAQSDLVLMLLRARIAAVAQLPLTSLETPTVLHYAPGQQFEPHFDFLDPNVPGYAHDLASNGQRIATFLLYLNDNFEGGETDFPAIGFRYRGKKGDALLFWNVTPDGEPDGQTMHAGLATTRGEKWLLSQWLRQPVCSSDDSS
jgi:prolyl 4-hydroxylase